MGNFKRKIGSMLGVLLLFTLGLMTMQHCEDDYPVGNEYYGGPTGIMFENNTDTVAHIGWIDTFYHYPMERSLDPKAGYLATDHFETWTDYMYTYRIWPMDNRTKGNYYIVDTVDVIYGKIVYQPIPSIKPYDSVLYKSK